MDGKEAVKKMIDESIEAKKRVYALSDDIAKSAEMMVSALKGGKKILICGNGGSASQAQHFAGEIVGRFEAERDGWGCIALTADSAILTALANDYGVDVIFSRQVEALGNAGDILIGISTSGNSANVIKAIEKAKEKGMKVITLTGKDGGKMKSIGDINLLVPANNTARVQESHILILHMQAKLVEDGMRE
jgi:D-sedoheptulose 7-phosphate isomerase